MQRSRELLLGRSGGGAGGQFGCAGADCSTGDGSPDGDGGTAGASSSSDSESMSLSSAISVSDNGTLRAGFVAESIKIALATSAP